MNEQRDKDARVRELLAERALFELSAAEQDEQESSVYIGTRSTGASGGG